MHLFCVNEKKETFTQKASLVPLFKHFKPQYPSFSFVHHVIKSSNLFSWWCETQKWPIRVAWISSRVRFGQIRSLCHKRLKILAISRGKVPPTSPHPPVPFWIRNRLIEYVYIDLFIVLCIVSIIDVYAVAKQTQITEQNKTLQWNDSPVACGGSTCVLNPIMN